jgi:hypothetical protein
VSRWLCREAALFPLGTVRLYRGFFLPRAGPFALGKASLCRELWIWLSAQDRALGRGGVSGSDDESTNIIFMLLAFMIILLYTVKVEKFDFEKF